MKKLFQEGERADTALELTGRNPFSLLALTFLILAAGLLLAQTLFVSDRTLQASLLLALLFSVALSGVLSIAAIFRAVAVAKAARAIQKPTTTALGRSIVALVLSAFAFVAFVVSSLFFSGVLKTAKPAKQEKSSRQGYKSYETQKEYEKRKRRERWE